MLFFLVATAVLLLDQISKYFAVKHLAFDAPAQVIDDFFDLALVYNPGAAFGIFANQRLLFFLFTVISIAVIFYVTAKHTKGKKGLNLIIGTILGGILGNFMDRIRLGYVVDFLDFHIRGYHWPAFNVADSAICIGIGILAILIIKDKK